MLELIDKKKYRFFVWVFLIGVGVFALAFFALTYVGQGVISTASPVPEEVGFINCLYFSVITITSLGYGDFRPIGFGKLLAGLEVIFGLTVVALAISKIASERTSTLVRLAYTSDVERRLRIFVEGNNCKNIELQQAKASHDFKKMEALVYSLRIDFTAYLHFFCFQRDEGDISGRWAEKFFLKVLRSVNKSVKLINEIGRLSNLTDAERKSCEYCMSRAEKLAQSLEAYYQDANLKGVASNIYQQIRDCKKHIEKSRHPNTPRTMLTEMSDEIVEKVRRLLSDDDSLPRHAYKAIALKLRISNNLAVRIIDKILLEEKISVRE